MGFACAKLGQLPGLRHIGGPVIVALLLPSCLVHYALLPKTLVHPIREFLDTTNIIYFFSTIVIVGGFLGMGRKSLIKGSVMAAMVGTLTGMAFGLKAHDTFFYIVIPIMAGGICEGAIPLTVGYASLLQLPKNELLAQVVPAIVLANICAVICAAALYRVLRRKDIHHRPTGESIATPSTPFFSVEQIASASMVAIGLYLTGLVIQHFTSDNVPAILGMLALVILIKLAGAIPSHLEQSAHWLNRLFAHASYPLLFGIGITLISWDTLLAALTPAYIATTIATVVTLMVTGYFVGRWTGQHAADSAIINACHSGMGSVGDLAILTASDRFSLMPFAQLATRLGGLLTVMFALILMKQFI
ncbi:hypothetical protein DFQ28_010631 [Apophysomyces sp. BC1034]|nr:hypothetical protein DFQ28_010631 [Apophysomyces sp. BC1034]